MDRLQSILVGGILTLLIGFTTYIIMIYNFYLTETAQFFTIEFLSPFIVLFILSIILSGAYSYFGGNYTVSYMISLSVFFGVFAGLTVGYFQFGISSAYLISIPISAFILGIAFTKLILIISHPSKMDSYLST